MATAREDEGPVCPICFDSFTIPKVLSCGHSYCLDCLKIYVADDVKHFLCAECRQQIDVPDDGLKAFPTNYALVKSAPVVTIASKCQNHAKKDAECYCRTCESVLCYRCLHVHHKDHDSFDLESEADQVNVIEEFSKCENDIRESIDRLKTVSKTLSNSITTYSHDECQKVDDYTKQVFSDIKQKAERAKTFIRHKCGEKLSDVEKREDEIREIAENAEVELVYIFLSSNDSFLTRVQNLPKLKQLDTKLREEDISLPKVEVLEWTPGSIAVPVNVGTVQIKPLLFPTDSPFVETEEGGDLQVETEDQGDDFQLETEDQGDDFQLKTEDQGDDFQLKTEDQDDDFQLETEDQGDDFQLKTEDQDDDFQLETEEDHYYQVVSSGDGTEKPVVQFSFNFGFDLKAWRYEMDYYSKDKFCVTALRKLVWSCYLTHFGNGFCGVYVVLLEDENKDIDHCVIDYRLSLSYTFFGETKVLKQERNARFNTDVSHGFSDTDIFCFDECECEIMFDIIKIKEIVNTF